MLLIGPAGSGKTTRALAELEAALGRGEPARLIVPTASMAAHLLHEMARRRGAVAGRPVVSLAEFVEALTPGRRQLSAAAEALLAELALRRTSPAEFGAVAGYPGFQRRFVETVAEFWAAGVAARDLARQPAGPFAPPFAAAMLEFEGLVAKAGAVHRSGRLRLAAAALRDSRPGVLLFDGFPNFAPVELELLRAARKAAARLLVTLPAAGAGEARRALAAQDFPETVLGQVWRPAPRTAVIRAPSPEREIEDLAGRILRDRQETGRPFHHYGVVLRNPEIYTPIVAVVFERFGIPFRSRQSVRLSDHAAVRRLVELLRAAPEPRRGDWTALCADLARRQYAPPPIEDRLPPAVVLQWRSLAAALRGWEQAAAEAAELLRLEGAAPGRASFLARLEAALRLSECPAPDRRREVVQVLSVYEARQWELPVVFVPGMVERQFPRHHGQNLFFDDGVRRRLGLLGWRLRTSEEREAEERLLFDLACTRATGQLYLTYPAQDDSGAETLRSFFLETDGTPAPALRVREPQPEWQPPPAVIADPALREAIAQRHEHVSPTALERYLQCPFQFFAERTLRLEGPPPAPEERVEEELWSGAVIHRTIALWASRRESAPATAIGPVFEEVFAGMCARDGIRLNFRAEARKAALGADLERFAAAERARPRPAGWHPGAPETSFEYVVEAGVERPFRVTGRIDRYDVGDDQAVVVVDYKYSGRARLQRVWREHEEGARVQAPLYLLGLERQRGLRPAGMMLYGLRQEPARCGWVAAGTPAEGLEDLTVQEPAVFRALLEDAAAKTVAIVGQIREGRVDVRPRDRLVCREFCAFRNVCRISL